MLESEPDLARFLIELRTLENALRERTTLILDGNTPSLRLLKSAEAGEARKSGR